MASAYCTPADVLALASLNAQARLTADPEDQRDVAVADGITHLFDTPFRRATLLKIFHGGILAATLAPGGTDSGVTFVVGEGADGTDQVRYAAPPIYQTIITATADDLAVDVGVIRLAIQNATSFINRKIPADIAVRLQPGQLRDAALTLVKWNLRRRRDMNEFDPMILEWKEVSSWLDRVGNFDTAIGEPVSTANRIRYSGEKPVFGPPSPSASLGDTVAS